MIIFKLDPKKWGRLCNQFFEVAATLNHAIECGTTARFPKWAYKEYFLNKIDDSLPETADRIFDGVKHDIYAQGANFHYVPIPKNKNLILEGYFQSEKFFEKHNAEVLKYFIPKPEFISEVRQATLQLLNMHEVTAIHVRRTDYLNYDGYYINCTIADYFTRAINIFKERGCRQFVVFSDDIQWCIQNFPPAFKDVEFHFITEGSDIFNLYRSALFKNHIMVNSTYAWWATYLHRLFNPNWRQEQYSVIPKEWFGPAAKHNAKDLYLNEWIKI